MRKLLICIAITFLTVTTYKATKSTIHAVKWVKKSFAFHYIKGNPNGEYRKDFIKKTGGKTCIGFTIPKYTVSDIRTVKEECKAASSLGIDSYILEFPFHWDNQLRPLTFQDFFIKFFSDIVNYFCKPAFVVTFVPPQYPITSKDIPNILVIRCESPKDNSLWKADFRYYDGYLSYQGYGKEYLTTQNIFDKFPRPTVYSSPHVAYVNYKPLEFNKIFYPSANWDALRTSEKYQKFLKRLSDDEIIQFFGPKEAWGHWNFIEKNYQGYISDKNNAYQKKMQSLGISLVLHSQDHLKAKTPSARIFESAAASTLIISDEHPFVKKEFGDTVLYVDTNQDEKKIYTQIKKHFEWVQTHPKEAAEKAKCAHRIFAEKFTTKKKFFEYLALYEQITKKS